MGDAGAALNVLVNLCQVTGWISETAFTARSRKRYPL
jgi:hypothetical protein